MPNQESIPVFRRGKEVDKHTEDLTPKPTVTDKEITLAVPKPKVKKATPVKHGLVS